MKHKSSAVKIGVFLLLLLFVPVIEAQRKKPVKKAVPSRAAVVEDLATIPEIKDFAFVVEIDKNANIRLRIQKNEDSESLADASTNKNLTDFFLAFSRLQDTKNSNKNSLDPIVIVKADTSLNYGKIVGTIKALRVSPKQKIKLQISDGHYVAISPIVNDDKPLKPNPLFLLVELRNDSKILLNREEYGSFENTAPLTAKLKEVFIDRDKFGMYRDGTGKIESTVFIAAPDSVKFSDVIRLIESIAETGAEPIGLHLDKEIFEAPAIPSNR